MLILVFVSTLHSVLFRVLKMSLTQLPASTIKLITSSQIITSVSSAIKELVENSLDAGATSVDVKLTNNGLDRIEVKDNGSGIRKENTTFVALPHYTSKLKTFSDLESLETYGFRGEALNALCQVGQVTLTTATTSDPMAIVYTLDASGNILGTKPSHHVQGTTVAVSNLFKNLPVRRQFVGSGRRAQEELKQVEKIVKSLAVIKPNIRVTLSHNKCQLWQKTPCSSLQSSFSQLVGYSTCQQLEQQFLRISDEIYADMLVPKKDCELSLVIKSTPAYSLVFINQRPVTYTKILKILNKQLAVFFGDQFPLRKFAVCLISMNCPPASVDVNLEPNKTKVLLTDEELVLNEIERQLGTYYSSPKPGVEECSVANSIPQLQPHQERLLTDTDEHRPTKKRKTENGLAVSECGSSEDKSQPSFEQDNNLNSTLTNQEIYTNTVEKTFVSHIPQCSVPSEVDRETNYIIQHHELPTLSIDDTSKCDASDYVCAPDHPAGRDQSQNVFSTNCFSATQLGDHATNTNCLSFIENVTNVNSEPNDGVLKPSDAEDLWDHIDDNHLDGITECLDALENMPIGTETKEDRVSNNPLKNLGSISAEAWSMGRVAISQGNLVKGSCVLVEGKTNGNGALLQVSSTASVPTHQIASEFSECNAEPMYEDRMKSVSTSPKKTQGIADAASPDFNSSLQSVSSQMGRRELAAFTKFAREVRPQIILENPGIAFTHVAALLSEKWRSLPSFEKDRYEAIAKETATTRKVWKTLDKQKQLDWVKELPAKTVRKKIQPSTLNGQKIHRKQSLLTISIDLVKEKCLKVGRPSESFDSSEICLIGQLEPSGTWICLEKSQISVLSHSRLQEVVVNDRLLHTFKLPLKPLETCQKLDSMTVGEDDWSTLVSLPCSFDIVRHLNFISADAILKNGFKIKISEDKQNATLMEVAETLNYYGVRELKETLALCRMWPDSELSKCRPLRVINHIRSEAMRICRKSPPILDGTLVKELLNYWKTVMHCKDTMCLHSKQILTPIFNLADRVPE